LRWKGKNEKREERGRGWGKGKRKRKRMKVFGVKLEKCETSVLGKSGECFSLSYSAGPWKMLSSLLD